MRADQNGERIVTAWPAAERCESHLPRRRQITLLTPHGAPNRESRVLNAGGANSKLLKLKDF